MAHIAKIPISVEFAPKTRKWELCDVQLADMPQPEPIRPAFVLPPLAPVQPFAPLRGIALRRKTAPAFYERVMHTNYMAYDALFSKSRLISLLEALSPLNWEGTMEILVSFPQDSKPIRLRNPWQMRDEFLTLPQSTKQLAKFLNSWGRWNGDGLSEYPFTPNKELGADRVEYVIPQDVWSLQATYRAALAGDAATWLSESGRIPTPTRRATAPFLATRDELCTSAIETTITMDKLADAPYRLCARVDCGQVFKIESNHGQIYCSHPCAHLVSVRRGREAKRQAKAKTAKGK